MCPKIVDKSQKRRQIINSAVKVFARQGLNDFKMIDIARQAGLGKGTIYEYFKSKDELVNSTFKMSILTFDTFVSKNIENQLSPADKIAALIMACLDFFNRHEDWVGIMCLFRTSLPSREKGNNYPTGFYEGLKKYLVSIIGEGINKKVFRPVDNSLAAAFIIALMDGMMFQALTGYIKNDRCLGERISELVLAYLKYK